MIYFTRASALAGLHEFACSQGLQPASLLRAAELPSSVLENPDGLIPYQRYGRLLELAAQQSGNPTFGLQFGLHHGVGVFGPLLYLMRNARTLEAALAELSLYFHVHNNVADVIIQRQDERALLCYNSLSADLPGLRQVSELALGVGHQLMRTLLGSRWQPQAVLFQHAPQASTRHYRRLLGITPRFNSPHCAWMFSAKLLDTPISDADAELHRLMQQHLRAMGRLQSGELPDYVQRLLHNFLPSGRVTIDYVAQFMRLSSRSLQRHLAEAGTSFQKLLDQTRQSMTLHYLKESEINLYQLSELLGYSDQSAFSRAFQRWYGMSPSQWNKLNNRRPMTRGAAL